MYVHVLMRDEKEERKKQARSNKQQGKATQHTQGSHFSIYMIAYTYNIHLQSCNTKLITKIIIHTSKTFTQITIMLLALNSVHNLYRDCT